MYLCKFGQNPSTGSKDIASERSYADADADRIRTKNNMSPTFGLGDIMSHDVMKKKTFCICENKGANQLCSNWRVTAKLISAFVFTTRIVQFLYFLNPKFPASSHLLCLYSSVYVRTVLKSHCWFSHEVAQIRLNNFSYQTYC